MTYYYNGQKMIPKMNQSIADMLDELGVSEKNRLKIIDWDTDLFCCMNFVDEFSEISEDVIDFHTKERLGVEILLPSEVDSDKGVLNHRWVRLVYCPFCGKSLRARMEEEE